MADASGCLLRLGAYTAVLAALAMPAWASVEISSNPTKNMNCAAGVCTPTAKNADLNAVDLANMLAASDVKVMTGSGAVTITVASSFSWTSAHRLTLDAMLNVSFRAPVTVAGQRGLTIVTNDGSSGGDLIFFPGGKVDFWDTGSNFILNGNSHTLVGDIATLATDIAANPSGFYALAKDYDAGPDGTYTRSPVFTELSGTVEGLGHAISNLSIKVTRKSWTDVGLFATTSASGTLRDINIVNANVATLIDDAHVGTLLGNGTGTIAQCSATGSVQTGGFPSLAGGLAGSAGTISRSNADVTVNGGDGDSGGLVGIAFSVSDSYATGTVSDAAAGGLAATNDGTILRSYATGQVTAHDYAGGGLVSNNSGQISQSYATGEVYGGEWAGGLAGDMDGEILNSYSTGSVHGGTSARVGGVVAQIAEGGIANFSYSTGTVHGPRHMRGGFVGQTDGMLLKSNYWDVTTSSENSGWGTCKGGRRHCERNVVGLTDDELKSALPAGFDASIWGQNPSVNNGYPYLLANPPQ